MNGRQKTDQHAHTHTRAQLSDLLFDPFGSPIGLQRNVFKSKVSALDEGRTVLVGAKVGVFEILFKYQYRYDV